MPSTQKVLKNSTETLSVYPPLLGVPSGVTVSIRPPGGVAGASVAASVGSGTATTTAAASQGDSSLALSSDPGISSGEVVVVTDANDGAKFTVKVRKTGTTLHLSNPLPRDLASGSTVSQYKASIQLSTSETALEGEGVAVWNHTIDGVVYTVTSTFIVVKYKKSLTLTSSVLTELFPITKILQDPQDTDYSEAINSAYKIWMRGDLLAQGIRPERIRNWRDLEEAHAVCTVYHLLQSDPGASLELVDKWKKLYQSRLSIALQSKEQWYDEDEELTERPEDLPDTLSQLRNSRMRIKL